MGFWGTNVIGNDIGADVVADFFEKYDSGSTPAEIRVELEKSYQDMISDSDDRNSFWFALVKAQWDVGVLDNDVLDRVRNIISSGSDLEGWKSLGASEKDLKKRETALKAFIAKIEVPNETPRKPRKAILRSSPFERGDILSIRLSDDSYGAVVVTQSEKQTKLGLTGVIGLYVHSKVQPTAESVSEADLLFSDFEGDNGAVWSCYYFAEGYKKCAHLFNKIGHVEVKKRLPEPKSYSGWHNLQAFFEARVLREEKAECPQTKLAFQDYV